MRFRYFGNASHSERVHELVEAQAVLLDQRFDTTDEELKTLDVTLHHHLKTNSFRAKLAFHAPGAIIAADGHARLLPTAIRRAFDDLNTQVDEHKARISSEPAARREALLTRAIEVDDPLGPALSGIQARRAPAAPEGGTIAPESEQSRPPS